MLYLFLWLSVSVSVSAAVAVAVAVAVAGKLLLAVRDCHLDSASGGTGRLLLRLIFLVRCDYWLGLGLVGLLLVNRMIWRSISFYLGLLVLLILLLNLVGRLRGLVRTDLYRSRLASGLGSLCKTL